MEVEIMRSFGRLVVIAFYAIGCGSSAADATECIVIKGFRVSTVGQCLEAEEEAGCIPRDRACNAEGTYAGSPDGECWFFLNSCLPDGWTPAISESTCTFTGEACQQN